MKSSILSTLRKQTKLIKFTIFLLSWSQVYAQGYSYYLNRPKDHFISPQAFQQAGAIEEKDAFGMPKAKANSYSLDGNEEKESLAYGGNSAETSRNQLFGTNVATSNSQNLKELKIAGVNSNPSRGGLSSVGALYYISDIKEGVIGKDEEYPLDQVYDNVFNISINDEIIGRSQYVLEYDLFGVKDYGGVSKVINDELASGGERVEKNSAWTHQTEAVSASSLRKGVNTVVFTIPASADYFYKVRNVRIGILGGGRDIGLSLPEKAFSVATASKSILQGSFAEISLNAAKLAVPQNSLKQTDILSITPLRDIDMPALDPEMVNVTATDTGYRLLPHGELFSAPAKISLGYDKGKIPAGYTEQDIKTFFFDNARKRWIALEKDSLEVREQIVVSNTTHFTDFVNGIIKVPESPETGSYAPNSIKDIKAADPASGVVSISAPSPNSMGTVNTSFPIKLPAGRGGMHPSLSVNYSSEGGNGWLGLGWDLSIPAVSIDTRWGVPTYGVDGNGVYNPSSAYETEIYTLGGEQLSFKDASTNSYVLPNKTEGFQKLRGTGDKQFYPRVEGSYSKIIRHGSSPSTYWWEVIGKDGTRSIFGNDGTGGDSYVLKDASGNIGHWALYKTIDTNGNYVVYEYDKKTYTPTASVMGKGGIEHYIKTITYTKNDISANPALKNYTVNFSYYANDDNNDATRPDVQVNARLGFVQVTSKRLGGIAVNYDNAPVRSYELEYREGAFRKSLLKSITEKDAAGNVFYTNRMEYNDETKGNVGAYIDKAISSNTAGDVENASILGSAESSNKTFGFSLGAGIVNMSDKNSANPTLRSGTLSFDYSYTKDRSKQLMSLNDLDGDGLLDKVFYGNGALRYRKNNIMPNVFNPFASSTNTPIGGGEIEKTTGHTNSFGTTFTVGSPFSANITSNFTTSRSVTENYFTDANGDGITDIVENGIVKFGVVDKTTGAVNYEQNSTNTPNPINPSSFGSIVTADPGEEATLKKENPLHDIVRVWKAPYTGTINIDNSIALSSSPANGQDGVDVVVQHFNAVTNVAAEISNRITLNSTVPRSFSLSRSVTKGDYIYFRLMSKDNGENDEVNWQSSISYPVASNANIPQTTDPNGLGYATFNSSEARLFTSKSGVGAISSGSATITGTFIKPFTTDSYTLYADVNRNGQFLQRINIESGIFATTGDDAATVNLNKEISVQEGDEIHLVVSSTSNIDWAALSFSDLKVTFTDPTDPGQVVEVPMVPEYRFYNWVKSNNTQQYPSSPFQGGIAGNYSIFPKLFFNTNIGGDVAPGDKKYTFIVKQLDSNNQFKKVFSREIDLNNWKGLPYDGSQNGIDPIDVSLTSGDKLYFEYYTDNNRLVEHTMDARAISYYNIPINNQPANIYLVDKDDIFDTSTSGSYPMNTDTDGRFGAMYRNWGSFSYNGNPPYGSSPIEQSALFVSTQSTANNEQLYDKRFIQTYPNTASSKYQGVTDLIYALGNTLSSSRMGIANIADVLGMSNPSGTGTNVVTAPKRITKTTGSGNSIGGSTPVSSLNASNSNSTSKRVSDYIDLNGDRYPDAVGDKVTFTNMLGSYMATPKAILDGAVTQTEASSTGVSTGSNISMPIISHNEYEKKTNPDGTKSTENQKDEEGNPIVSATRSIDAGLNFGGGSNNSEDKGEFTLNDINGDGLPDRVYKDGIRLNLGYRFAPKETISFGDFRIGMSETSNISAGVNVAGSNLTLATKGKTLFNGSIAFGGGGSQTDSYQKSMFADINGDGLVDKVRYDNASKALYASLNLGNTFDVERQWATGAAISNSTSRGQSLNFAVTAGIIIPILPPATPPLGVKISLTPSYSSGKGDSNTSYEISDIDGDGYPDLLINNSAGTFSNNTLNAKISTIGTTNLLKKVILPTGGTWEVEYDRVGNTYDMPQSKYVMTLVTVNDNFTKDAAFKPDVSKTSIAYTNGYHSRRERSFYGFESVKASQLKEDGTVYRYTVSTYNNKNYYSKGLLLTQALYDHSNKKWTENVNVYDARNLFSTTPVVLKDKEDEKRATSYAYFVAPIQSKSSFFEGQTGEKYTFQDMSYDTYGNATSVRQYGDTDIGSGDVLASSVTYKTVDNAATYYSLPTQVKSTATGVTRERRASYDEAGASPRLNLTQIQILDAAATPPTYNLEYDAYGNVIKSTGPSNYAGQRFYHLYTYDGQVKTYPIKVEDAFGYSSKTNYDFKFGVPTYSEDMNLQPMMYEYDSFGRTTKMIGPYELFSDVAAPWTIKFIYPQKFEAKTTEAEHFAKTIHYDPENPSTYDSNSGITTVTIADGLGAAVQVKKSASIYNAATGLDEEKYIVSGKVEQDVFGRVLKTYYPTLENTLNTSYVADVDTVTPTVGTYDVLDRALTTKLPGEDLLSTVTYGFNRDVQGRNMFETIFKDELGNIKKTYADIKGRTTSVWEPSNTGDIKTQFTHDALGNILKVVDVAGNETISTYDDLGRRKTYRHPDSGTTTYDYDTAGNLRYKTNAAGEKVEYVYDFNRLAEVKYPKYTENNVKYYYGKAKDASAMDNNAVGRLWYQTDATGTQYLKYGKLGELTYQRRSVAVPGASVYWFATEWQYDTWNRVKTITYPDGEKLTYAYNKAGNLKSMASQKDTFSQNIVRNLGYDKFEQRVFLEYGNGTKTTYEYETERRRLLKLHANTKSNRAFQQNVYQYDAVSNVLQIHNNAPFAPAGLLGGGTNYTFGYDDLYRLSSASGNWRGMNSSRQEERQRYTVTMAYDNMHNVTRKEQKHERSMGATGNTWINMEPTSYRLNYHYRNNKPHQIDYIVDEPNLVPNVSCCNRDNPSVNFANYLYDAKGNILNIEKNTCSVSDDDRIFTWDEENRLRYVDTNPSTAEIDGVAIYTYDAGGERIIKDFLYSSLVQVNYANLSTLSTSSPTEHKATIYPNGLISMDLEFEGGYLFNGTSYKYTKHYYAGSQRIGSKIGLGKNVGQFNCAWLIIPFGGGSAAINEKATAKEKLDANTAASLALMQARGITPPVNYGQNAGYGEECVSSYSGTQEKEMYWFHANHLGSSSFITGIDGEVNQNIEYFPSGEVFVENHMNSYNTPYKFNGKELDSETGYYYYGARYYNPRTSLWLSVDPLAERHPEMSPYVYTANNPVRFIDPDGRDWVEDKNGNVTWRKDVNAENYSSVLKSGEIYRGTDYVRYKEWNNDRAKGLVQEHYKSDRVLHYEAHDGTFQLDFTGRIATDNEITGKELSNSKHADDGILGQMYLNAVFSDGGTYTYATYDFASGPYANGPTPNKNYTANWDSKNSITSESGMQIYGKTGWKLFLEDYKGRDGLRIHPDTNGRGTAGCIGVQGTEKQLKTLGNFFEVYIKERGGIKVNFQIPGNPNYGNEGRAHKTGQ